MKLDVSYHKATYEHWKDKVLNEGIVELSKRNSELLIKYILDMEQGNNIASRHKKGGRSYGRLNVLRRKLVQLFIMLEELGFKDITKIDSETLIKFTKRLNDGEIKRQDGEAYGSPSDFIMNFKAFWHWWMKVNRKEEKYILDLTEDLELKKTATKFVYFTKEQLDQMLPYFNPDEQILCEFLFDSIIRFPTECLSLRVKDIYQKENEVWISIPREITKTDRDRHFNLLYCGEALLKYIKDKEKEPNDLLFHIKDQNGVYIFNTKLKQVAVQLFGDKLSHPKARGHFSELSGYDFRHSGAIHLRILASKNNAISLDAIRERGGWQDFDMLNYYTKFIGLSGEIKKEALLIEEDRTRLEKELELMKKDLTKLSKKDELNATALNLMYKYSYKHMKNMKPEDKKVLSALSKIAETLK